MAYSKNFYDSLKGNDLKREGFRNYYIPVIKQIFSSSQKQLESVIDIGCGTGMLLSVFEEENVKDFCGVDFCDFSSMIEIPIDKYIAHNLNDIDSLVIQKKYDIACCLEVAEHLLPATAKKLVHFLSSVSDVVWFSAAVPYQCGEGHVNEQWPEYWEKMFDEEGYVRVDYFRKETWDMRELPGYYRQNMCFYIRKNVLPSYKLLNVFYNNHNDDLPKHLIHPTTYMYSVLNYNNHTNRE